MLLLSCTFRHVRYIITTQHFIKHRDRKCPCIQSKADFLIDTQTHQGTKVDTFTHIYVLHKNHAHTHTARISA